VAVPLNIGHRDDSRVSVTMIGSCPDMIVMSPSRRQHHRPHFAGKQDPLRRDQLKQDIGQHGISP